MSRRGLIIGTLVFLVGLAIGGGIVESYHRSQAKRAQELFSQRFRCKTLADQYVKRESSESTAIILNNVDYSVLSNSCVGYFDRIEDIPREHYLTQDNISLVIDLLTGEELYQDHCIEDTDCGRGNDFRIMREAKAAFDEAVNNKKPSGHK